MKKIGILTYHTGYNYGASLQAFALQSIIKGFYPDCKIINFEPTRFLASREMFCRKIERSKELVKVITRQPYKSALLRRQKMFDLFTNEILDVTEPYRTEQEVIDHAGEFDCIVCGSDQIWNLSSTDAPAANALFFLNFPKTQRRISYAASFGKWLSEAPAHEENFIPWLREFDAVSVREENAEKYLFSRNIQCQTCLDPTLLLSSDDFDKICADRLVNEPYILMFGWNTNKELVSAAKKVARKTKLPIYNIVPPPRGIGSGIKRKLDVGPREFLSMIKYAEFIVTNSFHGTVFSTIYEKPYISVITGVPDTRMYSLLSQLNLTDHLVLPREIDFDAVVNTDYNAVRELRFRLLESSLSYLKEALEVKND